MRKKPYSKKLAECLAFIKTVSSQSMDLSLERILPLASAWKSFSCPVITVAGTNGKGTSVYALESIYRANGYKTGLFTSPFLFRYEEQIQINGLSITEEALCDAFSEVEKKRGDIELTSFEYLTLAALCYFQTQSLDILILEVGLGGRLDAVNVVDSDIAVITNISLDHTDYLGNTRDQIALEKAGILRAGKAWVYSEKDLPHSLLSISHEKKAPLYLLGEQFNYQQNSDGTWNWFDGEKTLSNLPKTHLHLDNLAGALMAIQLLQNKLVVSLESIRSGIQAINIPGRVQVMQGKILHILDVSHNPASIAWLSQCIFAMKIQGKMRAVFSMLKDKNIQESIAQIQDQIDDWYVAPIQNERACSIEEFKVIFSEEFLSPKMQFFKDLKKAYSAAISESQIGDAIIIFGSFHTVREVVDGGLD